MATFLGTVLAVSFPAGAAACATWLVVAVIGRISSLSALAAVVLTPLWMWMFDYRIGVVLGLVLAALVWMRHAANIRRLLAGTEPRIGQK